MLIATIQGLCGLECDLRMGKQRTGYIFQDPDKRWWARVTFTDSRGKRHYLKRLGRNKTDANNHLKKLIRKIDDNGELAILGGRMLFSKLLDQYASTYVVEPVYEGDSKIAGMRTHQKATSTVKVLHDYFGRKQIERITYGDLERFRNDRLATPTRRVKVVNGVKQGGKRSLASVNRELSFMRAVLGYAVREGYLTKSPFAAAQGSSSIRLISIADEKPRDRLPSRDEESRLIAACVGRREHIRPVIVIALDTGLRRGEILSLTWNDVDLEGRTLTIQARNTKTLRRRVIGITRRVEEELRRLALLGVRPTDRIFPFRDMKNAWRGVLKTAGITDLRFHDLRHSFASKLANSLTLTQIAKLLGHSQPQTSYKHYINPDRELLDRAVGVLDSLFGDEKETVIN